MRGVFRALLIVLMAVVNSTVPAADPARTIERSGGGVGVVSPNRKKQQDTTVTITAVSPLRQWTSVDGKIMQGRLLAFSAPKPGETGPVVVIKEGKVRLLRAGTRRHSDIYLALLSKDDQKFILKIAAEASKGPPSTKKSQKRSDPGMRLYFP